MLLRAMSGISKGRSDNTLAIVSVSHLPQSPFRSAAVQYRYIGSSRRRAYGAMWASRPTGRGLSLSSVGHDAHIVPRTLCQMPGVRGPGACPRRVPRRPGENAGGKPPAHRDSCPSLAGEASDNAPPDKSSGELCVFIVSILPSPMTPQLLLR